MSKQLRSMNDIMLDMEVLLEELTDEDQQGMQTGEVLALIKNWIDVHAPQAIEEYLDGSNPKYFYGPEETLQDLYFKAAKQRGW